MDLDYCSGLWDYLKQIPDPRKPRGQRYPWEVLLAVVSLGLSAGCRGPRAIWEWSWCHWETLRAAIALPLDRLPSESTLQRVFREVDVDALEAQVSAHNQACAAAAMEVGTEPRALSLDGKWVRQASKHTGPVILQGVWDEDAGMMVVQQRVPAGTNEKGAAPGLLADLDLTGCLVTMDAGVTSKALMRQITAQGGDYLMVVKDDTELLRDAIKLLFETPPEGFDPTRAEAKTVEKGHGRLEVRELLCSELLRDWIEDWPRPGLVLKRTCRRRLARSGKEQSSTVYAMTSLTFQRATPEQLLRWWRGHWGIENRAHYVRDVTFGEDRTAVWKGDGPQVLAALRNGLVAVFRRCGRWEQVTSMLRAAFANPILAMKLIGVPFTMH